MTKSASCVIMLAHRKGERLPNHNKAFDVLISDNTPDYPCCLHGSRLHREESGGLGPARDNEAPMPCRHNSRVFFRGSRNQNDSDKQQGNRDAVLAENVENGGNDLRKDFTG